MYTPHAQQNTERGITLLVAVLVVGIVLAIGLSILNITVKEFLLSGVARESAIAFNAADAGMECIFYWDRSSTGNHFDIGAPASDITCMGETVSVGGGVSGTAQNFELTWGDPALCSKISVTKYYSASGSINMGDGICPQGIECTRSISLGYNKACSQLSTPNTIERGLRELYY